MKKINYKLLIFNILLPLTIGFIGSLLGGFNNFELIMMISHLISFDWD